MFHFVRLLKFLPAAYFINDFLSPVNMITRIRHDRNKRHYQIVILVNNQGITNLRDNDDVACLALVRRINDEFKNWRELEQDYRKKIYKLVFNFLYDVKEG